MSINIAPETATPPTFGERLRHARLEAELSQAGLAMAAGAKPQAVQQYEYDGVLPTATRMPLLEDALNLEQGTLGAWVRYSPLYMATLPPAPDTGAIPGLLRLVTPYDEAA